MGLYKVLMFGARDWENRASIIIELNSLIAKHGVTKLLIIEGGAPGADRLCGEVARNLNVHVAEVKALWDTRHNGAGPQRNTIMRLLEPDEGIGFHEDIENSKGSKNMMEQLEKAGIPYRIVKS